MAEHQDKPLNEYVSRDSDVQFSKEAKLLTTVV